MMTSRLFEDKHEGGKAWYALHVKPHKEIQVYRYLRSSGQDVDVYFPSYTVDPVNPRSRRVRPYFPRYVFVEASLDALGESFLQWIPGSVGLVRFGGEPAIVPEHFMHDLKKRVIAFEKAGGPPGDDIRQGDRIRVASGPFTDYEGVFQSRLSGEERVQVFLDWLGRRVAVTMNMRDLRRVKS
jgi:transcriptional antiterminator RfaH